MGTHRRNKTQQVRLSLAVTELCNAAREVTVGKRGRFIAYLIGQLTYEWRDRDRRGEGPSRGQDD